MVNVRLFFVAKWDGHASFFYQEQRVLPGP